MKSRRAGYFYLCLSVLVVSPVFSAVIGMKDGNLTLMRDDGQSTQLTTDGGYSGVATSPNKQFAVSTRKTPEITEFWRYTFSDNRLEKISPKNEEAEIDRKMGEVRSLQFSPDSKTVFFLAGWWETSDRVFALNLKTGTLRPLVPGNALTVQSDGNLVVNQHRHGTKGAYDCDFLFTPSGKEIKNLGNCG